MKKSNSKSFRYQNYQRNLINVTTATNVGINNHDRLVKAYGSTANRIEVLNMLKKQSKFLRYTETLEFWYLQLSAWFYRALIR